MAQYPLWKKYSWKKEYWSKCQPGEADYSGGYLYLTMKTATAMIPHFSAMSLKSIFCFLFWLRNPKWQTITYCRSICYPTLFCRYLTKKYPQVKSLISTFQIFSITVWSLQNLCSLGSFGTAACRIDAFLLIGSIKKLCCTSTLPLTLEEVTYPHLHLKLRKVF